MKKKRLLVLVVLTGMFLLSASIVWAQSEPRFKDRGDGTVKDTQTGLMWAKNANLNNGPMNWYAATDYANNLSLGTSCGEAYTDWRLPQWHELSNLIDTSESSPALPDGHPFTNVQYYNLSFYWTDFEYCISGCVYGTVSFFEEGEENVDWPSNEHYVWPVRSAN